MQPQEELNALFQYATEGMLIVNEQGEIIRINPSAERLFGYENEELLGRKIEVLVPSRYTKQHERHRTTYRDNPHARSMGVDIDLFGRKKDGSEFPVEVSLSPYETDKGKFVIGFIVDITQRKQAEERLKNYSSELENQVRDRTLVLQEAIVELEQTKVELNEALNKERELNDLKSRFVSLASHEFRTPLTTILSSLSLAKRYDGTKDKDKKEKHFGRIEEAVNSLTDILNDFLSLSKLEEGKVTYNPERFDITTFINEVAYDMQQIAKQDQIVRHVHAGENTNVTLDKKILKHVLFNLISNAIKFSEEGKTIDVSTELQDGMLTVKVADQGIGIPEDDVEHMFQRFFRAHNVTNIQGTGLGLSIVAKYVELMNGSISFESKQNVGTTFTLLILQHENDSAHRGQQEHPRKHSGNIGVS